MAYLQHNKHNISVFEHIIACIAPHVCLCCGLEGTLLCKTCIHRLPAAEAAARRNALRRVQALMERPVGGVGIIAAARYEGLAKELVGCLKFGRARSAAAVIGDVLDEAAEPNADFSGTETAAVVTFVPTTGRRMRVRGYDQAEQIAKSFAAAIRLPCRRHLRRVTSYRQVGSGRAARLHQTRGSVQAAAVGSLCGKHVYLIDDVITTGASMAAAADALLAAGAYRVTIVAFALA